MGLRQIIPEAGSESSEVEPIVSIGSDSLFVQQAALRWLRTVLERLRQQHLGQRGLYTRLRGLLPLPALLFVWLRVTYASRPFSSANFVDSSITVRHLLLGLVIAAVWSLSTQWRTRASGSLREELWTEFGKILLGSGISALVLFLGCRHHLGEIESASLSISLAYALGASSLLLLLATLIVSAEILRYPGKPRKALIVGSGRRASLLRKLAKDSESRLSIIGCLDDEYSGSDRKKDNYLGGLAGLADILKANPVELVLIGLPTRSHYEKIQRVIEVCECIGVECQYMPDIFATSRVTLQSSTAASSVAVLADRPRVFGRWLKRAVDLLIATPLLMLSLPLMALIALAIKLTSPGPVLFIQQRYGFNRHRFPMLKFRTMVQDAELRQASLERANETDGPTFKLKADPRITGVGKFLRRTSLDELPQLINVLRGEMSLVGPRPLPLRDVSRFDKPWLLRRFSVPPGLTCLWQIGGRSNTKFDEWIRLDLQYVDNWSLFLDLRILALTIPAVLRGSGAV